MVDGQNGQTGQSVSAVIKIDQEHARRHHQKMEDLTAMGVTKIILYVNL